MLRHSPRVAVLLLLAGAALAAGCTKVKGSGRAFTEDRRIAPFDAVVASGSLRVEIAVGDGTACSVTADDNVVPLITTTVAQGVLRIDATERFKPQTPVEVRLITPRLGRLEVSGAADALVRGARGAALEIEVSGAGDVTLSDIAVDRLALEISGAADVSGSGFARRLEYEISGAGKAKLGELCAREATVEISGAGSATVAVNDRLEAKISGAGSIDYYGEPAVVQPEIAGAGSIKSRGPSARCPRQPAAGVQLR
jgi:hypothetical protein